MSELLAKLASHIRKASNPALHVVSGSDLQEDAPGLAAAEPKTAKAEPLDGSRGMDPVKVGEPVSGKLSYFLDGIERTHVPCYYSMVPIVYGYVAAVIRKRGPDCAMRTHCQPLSSEALYFPLRLVHSAGFEEAGIPVMDTETGNQPLEEHPLILREAARVAISKARGRLETQLSRAWLSEFEGGDDWLVVDGSLGGTLGGDYARWPGPNILGVIKSHQTQYFPMDEQRKVLGLRAGERSGLFRPLERERQAPVHSWYLRLRPNEGRDVYFGLIRLEIPASDRSEDIAEQVSRWLLAERCPLSLPDARWDRMLYPVRDCEQYLRSLAPSRIALEASMIGVGAVR